MMYSEEALRAGFVRCAGSTWSRRSHVLRDREELRAKAIQMAQLIASHSPVAVLVRCGDRSIS